MEDVQQKIHWLEIQGCYLYFLWHLKQSRTLWEEDANPTGSLVYKLKTKNLLCFNSVRKGLALSFHIHMYMFRALIVFKLSFESLFSCIKLF